MKYIPKTPEIVITAMKAVAGRLYKVRDMNNIVVLAFEPCSSQCDWTKINGNHDKHNNDIHFIRMTDASGLILYDTTVLIDLGEAVITGE